MNNNNNERMTFNRTNGSYSKKTRECYICRNEKRKIRTLVTQKDGNSCCPAPDSQDCYECQNNMKLIEEYMTQNVAEVENIKYEFQRYFCACATNREKANAENSLVDVKDKKTADHGTTSEKNELRYCDVGIHCGICLESRKLIDEYLKKNDVVVQAAPLISTVSTQVKSAAEPELTQTSDVSTKEKEVANVLLSPDDQTGVVNTQTKKSPLISVVEIVLTSSYDKETNNTNMQTIDIKLPDDQKLEVNTDKKKSIISSVEITLISPDGDNKEINVQTHDTNFNKSIGKERDYNIYSPNGSTFVKNILYEEAKQSETKCTDKTCASLVDQEIQSIHEHEDTNKITCGYCTPVTGSVISKNTIQEKVKSSHTDTISNVNQEETENINFTPYNRAENRDCCLCIHEAKSESSKIEKHHEGANVHSEKLADLQEERIINKTDEHSNKHSVYFNKTKIECIESVCTLLAENKGSGLSDKQENEINLAYEKTVFGSETNCYSGIPDDEFATSKTSSTNRNNGVHSNPTDFEKNQLCIDDTESSKIEKGASVQSNSSKSAIVQDEKMSSDNGVYSVHGVKSESIIPKNNTEAECTGKEIQSLQEQEKKIQSVQEQKDNNSKINNGSCIAVEETQSCTNSICAALVKEGSQSLHKQEKEIQSIQEQKDNNSKLNDGTCIAIKENSFCTDSICTALVKDGSHQEPKMQCEQDEESVVPKTLSPTYRPNFYSPNAEAECTEAISTVPEGKEIQSLHEQEKEIQSVHEQIDVNSKINDGSDITFEESSFCTESICAALVKGSQSVFHPDNTKTECTGSICTVPEEKELEMANQSEFCTASICAGLVDEEIQSSHNCNKISYQQSSNKRIAVTRNVLYEEVKHIETEYNEHQDSSSKISFGVCSPDKGSAISKNITPDEEENTNPERTDQPLVTKDFETTNSKPICEANVQINESGMTKIVSHEQPENVNYTSCMDRENVIACCTNLERRECCGFCVTDKDTKSSIPANDEDRASMYSSSVKPVENITDTETSNIQGNDYLEYAESSHGEDNKSSKHANDKEAGNANDKDSCSHKLVENVTYSGNCNIEDSNKYVENAETTPEDDKSSHFSKSLNYKGVKSASESIVTKKTISCKPSIESGIHCSSFTQKRSHSSNASKPIESTSKHVKSEQLKVMGQDSQVTNQLLVVTSDVNPEPQKPNSILTNCKECCKDGRCNIKRFINLCKDDAEAVVNMYMATTRSNKSTCSDNNFDPAEKYNSYISTTHGDKYGDAKYHFLMVDVSTSYAKKKCQYSKKEEHGIETTQIDNKNSQEVVINVVDEALNDQSHIGEYELEKGQQDKIIETVPTINNHYEHILTEKVDERSNSFKVENNQQVAHLHLIHDHGYVSTESEKDFSLINKHDAEGQEQIQHVTEADVKDEDKIHSSETELSCTDHERNVSTTEVEDDVEARTPSKTPDSKEIDMTEIVPQQNENQGRRISIAWSEQVEGSDNRKASMASNIAKRSASAETNDRRASLVSWSETPTTSHSYREKVQTSLDHFVEEAKHRASSAAGENVPASPQQTTKSTILDQVIRKEKRRGSINAKTLIVNSSHNILVDHANKEVHATKPPIKCCNFFGKKKETPARMKRGSKAQKRKKRNSLGTEMLDSDDESSDSIENDDENVKPIQENVNNDKPGTKSNKVIEDRNRSSSSSNSRRSSIDSYRRRTVSIDHPVFEKKKTINKYLHNV